MFAAAAARRITLAGAVFGAAACTNRDVAGPGRALRNPFAGVEEGIIAAGDDFTCALASDSTAWCWGSNARGQLGDGQRPANSMVPVKVSGGRRFAWLTAGNNFACALDAGGDAWCWGSNNSYQLGTGTSLPDIDMPVPVFTDLRFTRIAAAGEGTCGLSTGNQVWCWGYHGISTEAYAVPVLSVGDPLFASLSIGWAHGCGITRAAETWCFGLNYRGQLGAGDGDPTIELARTAGPPFVSVVAGNETSCGLTGDSAAWCWGSNFYGQLGMGAVNYEQRNADPVAVAGAHRYAQLTVGARSACGITGDGTGLCWGVDPLTDTQRAEPEVVPGAVQFRALAVGLYHRCGIGRDGAAWCWGLNTSGQLGDGTRQHRAEPVAVGGLGGAGTTGGGACSSPRRDTSGLGAVPCF